MHTRMDLFHAAHATYVCIRLHLHTYVYLYICTYSYVGTMQWGKTLESSRIRELIPSYDY